MPRAFLQSIKLKDFLLFIPGLLVLVFGYIVLHTSQDFSAYHQETIKALHHVYGGESSLEEWKSVSSPFDYSERVLYFSIVLMSVTSFFLFVLMAFFYRKAVSNNGDKAKHFQYLERLVAVLEASLDGIMIVNDDRSVSFINASLLKIMGFDEDCVEKYIGQDWKNLFGGMIDEYLQADIFTALTEHRRWSGEFEIVTSEGQQRVLFLSATSLKDGGHICTVHDMTVEKQAQDDKVELQDQFYQSQKMEAIGRLAGGIAHDFNNILAAINGYAEFLVEDLDEQQELQVFASNILQAGQRAKGLVDQMLAFSRRKENDRDAIDLKASIRETLSMLKASLPKTIEVNHEIELDDAYIRGNTSQITQVLMNLCVNASDAMDNERGTLSIRLFSPTFSEFPMPKFIREELLDPKDIAPISFKEVSDERTVLALGVVSKHQPYHCLSISDTGTGMSKVIMERIFEPFFTTKAVDKGTGLGLAMVHGAITAHRGCMIIDSILGEGTRFDLYFPADNSYEASPRTGENKVEEFLDDAMVLVVEDQRDVREMIISLLERLGVDAEGAENGLEGLAILRENPDAFDFVITDYNMPHMTGLELIQHAGNEFPEIPFILLSGYSKEKVRDLIDEQPNVYAALRKPVAKDKLLKVIKSMMDERALLAGAA